MAVTHDTKYDRQLRLWGPQGQHRLQSASVLLLSASAVGAETLKNLVLPGLGSATIVDSSSVTTRDLANNFFLDASSVGLPRAETVCRLLTDLNDECCLTSIGEDVVSFCSQPLSSLHGCLAGYSVVVATDVQPEALCRLADACWSCEIPLIIIKCCGLFGYLRVVMGERLIIEPKPEPVAYNLRLRHPFPALLSLAATADHILSLPDTALTSTSLSLHSHIPFALLLLVYAQRWRLSHHGSYPSFKDRHEFCEAMLSDSRQFIARYNMRFPELAFVDREANYEEAVAQVRHVTSSVSEDVPDNVQYILDYYRPRLEGEVTEALTGQLTEKQRSLIITSAIHTFLTTTGDGRLPLNGVVPDMHADTVSYLALKHAYAEQARAESEAVMALVTDMVTRRGGGGDGNGGTILTPADDAWFRVAIKEVHGWRLHQGRSLDTEVSSPSPALSDALCTALSSHSDEVPPLLSNSCPPSPSPSLPPSAPSLPHVITHVVCWRAMDQFYKHYHRYPGSIHVPAEQCGAEQCGAEQCDGSAIVGYSDDILPFTHLVTVQLQHLGIDVSPSPSLMAEWCRAGGSSVATTASVMGGIAAQELIKIVTAQFVPLDNSLLWDGVTGTMDRVLA